MKFVAHAKYGVDRPAVTSVLPAHTDYAELLKSQGQVAVAGPYMNERGEFLGVHFVYEAGSQQEAAKLAHNDPFSREGIFTSLTVKRWGMLGHNRKLLEQIQRGLERSDAGNADRKPRTFLCCTQYSDDAAKLAKVRPSHREYAKTLRAQDKLAMAGPLADDTGAILVYEAASRDDAIRLLREDPFAAEGVLASFELSEWQIRGLNIGLFEDSGR